MKQYTTLLFDLDGTLVDSGEGIMRCAQYALAHFGIDVPDYHSLRPFVGPPLEDSFIDFFGFSPDDAARAVEAYRKRYFEKGVYEQHVYEGVEQFLAEIRRRGYVMAIATSKTRLQAEFVIKEFRLRQYFDYVFGRDEEGLLHTKADVIRDGLQKMGNPDLSQVLMIGDRKFDVEGARECGLRSLGVLYGYGDIEEMRSCGADFIAESFDEMLKML